MLPSLFLVLWVYALILSDAWSGKPDLGALGKGLGSISVGEVAWLLISTLLVALFLHPFIFGMTRLLEGYWGSSRAGVALAAARIAHHRRRHSRLEDAAFEASKRIECAARELNKRPDGRDPFDGDPEKLEAATVRLLYSEQGDHLIRHSVVKEEAESAAAEYPDRDRILPTRLGNVLRHFEDKNGRQYGLDDITTAPHFPLVIPERHAKYLADCGEEMDVAIRLCADSLLATLVAIPFLLTDGLWLLVALVPYILAYLAYRAAISAAKSFGIATSTIVDLDRFLLYDSLGLERPRSTRGERRQNERLMALLDGDDSAVVRYAKKEEPPPQPSSQ